MNNIIKLIVHTNDIGNNSSKKFGDGLFIREGIIDNKQHCFVKWPHSTNGIIAGWYSSKKLIIMRIK